MRARYFLSIFIIFAAALPAPAETNYYAVFMSGKKIGHSIKNRVVENERVITTQEASMEVDRGGTAAKMNIKETSIETTDGKPLSFKIVQKTGTTEITISGEVDTLWIVNLTAESMGTKQRKSFGWPSGAVMAEGLRLLQLEKGLKEGLEYNAKVFSPGSGQALDVAMRVGAKQNIDLLGRVAALTEIKIVMKVPGGGEIVTTNYVDENLRMQKSITSLMGTQTETIVCTREFALGENDVVDLIDKMFLASPEPLNNIESAKSAKYYLNETNPSTKLVIPSSDNQSVEQLDGGIVIVTVKPVTAQAGVKFPYEGKDSNALEAMKPTSYVQSDNNDVIALAKRAVGEIKDAAEAVKKIESFVSGYIENKGLSVGYASAAEVAVNKSGDCSEFAVLTAAMCRAVGIPARVVTGLVYTKTFGNKENVFGGHAWAEAYVGDKWIGLDATKTPKGFDAGHIALAIGSGEPADFLNLAATLGRFKIGKVTIEAEKTQ